MNRASSSHNGFTIIETLLFLGVTGLMLATMFVGIGTSIGTQRYKDAVESFKSTLQQQYSDVTNVQNERQGAWTCVRSGSNLSVQPSEGGTLRGQDACEIIGKYITIKGEDISARTVVGLKVANPGTAADTDIQKLNNGYTLGVSDINATTTKLEWGTRIAWPENEGPVSGAERELSILIVRSPSSGAVYTFTGDTIPLAVGNTHLKSLLVAATDAVPGRAARMLCVDSNGLVATPARAVIIEANAADSSAVRVALPADFSGGRSC